MYEIFTSCPTRVDLAGGTLDLWPIHHLIDDKATVNIAIDLNATVNISMRSDKHYEIKSIDQNKIISGSYSQIVSASDLPLISLILKQVWDKDNSGLNISLSAGSPKGAGLGGSSALTIASVSSLYSLLKKLGRQDYQNIDNKNYVAAAQNIEARLIHSPTGLQDYWASIKGGVNLIDYSLSEPRVLTLSQELLGDLDKHIIVCYSGQSRASADNNWHIYKKVFEKDSQAMEHLQQIGIFAKKCASALQDKDILEALSFSEKEWQIRISLWPDIETQATKNITNLAKRAGAIFSRVCGAGGGGCMVVICHPKDKINISNYLTKNGVQVLQTSATYHGLKFRLKSMSSTV
jgi:D-glycero-alpha-D-manno-heptose-7-phosphate kinase